MKTDSHNRIAGTSVAALDTREVYRRRFRGEETFRDKMWQLLCREYFQRFVPSTATVLEVAAGYCEFVNNISASHKIAVDINPETGKKANSDVRVIITSSTDLSALASESIDIIFVSNFFEHLSKEDITRTVRECYRVMKAGGRFLILQPNIRYVYKDYWMFYDHITPIDDRALVELLEIIGFKVTLHLAKFLPYTTKSKLPKSLFLLKLYLRVRLLQKIFGGQAFVVAEK
jgi:ubiquinone/menaquinone biosynthesis C-methylase UbiE